MTPCKCIVQNYMEEEVNYEVKLRKKAKYCEIFGLKYSILAISVVRALGYIQARREDVARANMFQPSWRQTPKSILLGLLICRQVRQGT